LIRLLAALKVTLLQGPTVFKFVWQVMLPYRPLPS